MKNKEKYNLCDLKFVKKKITQKEDFRLYYITEVIYRGKKVGYFDGASFAERMVWLEREYDG